MLANILIPLDGSPVADSILPQVRPLLERKGTEAILLRAVESSSLDGTATDLEEHLAQAREHLRLKERQLEDQGLRVRWTVEHGSPSRTILEVAARERASLIAMSTHGRSGVARAVMGSVAETVIRASRVPVLALRSRPARLESEAEPLPGWQTILVPVDERGIYRGIVPHVADVAGIFGSHVLLLHVRPTRNAGLNGQRGLLALRRAKRMFEIMNIKAETILEEGNPAVVILDVARNYRSGLIAMATHGRKGVSRLFLGSVTEEVLRHSDLPMLLLRPPKKAQRLVSLQTRQESHGLE